MTIFVTSDLHFGHENILKYCSESRPFSNVDEMDEALIEEWNAVVSPNDDIYNLGDFSFHRPEKTVEILNRLNGRHHLVCGNHDGAITRMLKKGATLNDLNLASVSNYLEIKYHRQKIVMFHYPIVSWNGMHRGSIMLHGHSHGSFEGKGYIFDCGIDSKSIPSNMRPFRLDDIIDYLHKNRTVSK